jgi:hypothetical protein
MLLVFIMLSNSHVFLKSRMIVYSLKGLIWKLFVTGTKTIGNCLYGRKKYFGLVMPLGIWLWPLTSKFKKTLYKPMFCMSKNFLLYIVANPTSYIKSCIVMLDRTLYNLNEKCTLSDKVKGHRRPWQYVCDGNACNTLLFINDWRY